jgi:hypothetical protein
VQTSIRTMSLCLYLVTAACAQNPEKAQPYDVKEAYLVYKTVIPLNLDQHATLVIAEQTSPGQPSIERCLASPTVERFKTAITDYNRLSKSKWTLQNQFLVKRKYKLVSSDTLKAIFERSASSNQTLEDSWQEFYKRYPGSGGIVNLSVVGFNNDNTLAVVYAGRSCGSLCGEWSWHLLEKKDASWKEVPGVGCHTVS